jgi:ATP-dependent helicase/DNAse subunit B
MIEKNKRILSASRIKTLESCSWSYWCNYHLKVPQRGNDGARRGTVCHLIFECLLKQRHKKHYDLIMKESNTEASKSVVALVKKGLKREGAFSKENFELCMKMILVALNQDFYGTGEELEPAAPELEFLLENKNPKYRIRGFIDKTLRYKDKVKIIDYKTSKYKFKGDELTANVQAMAYTLASRKKLFPKIKNVEVEFQFLKFPRQPLQQVKSSEEQLKGFEHYLAHVYKIINNFDNDTARTNFAVDSNKNRWLCKAGATWRCPYLDPVDYYAIKNDFDEVVTTAFEEKGLRPLRKGEKLVKLRYEGCPAHTYSDTSFGTKDDPFDWA